MTSRRSLTSARVAELVAVEVVGEEALRSIVNSEAPQAARDLASARLLAGKIVALSVVTLVATTVTTV
jgi:hypothetical protein